LAERATYQAIISELDFIFHNKKPDKDVEGAQSQDHPTAKERGK